MANHAHVSSKFELYHSVLANHQQMKLSKDHHENYNIVKVICQKTLNNTYQYRKGLLWTVYRFAKFHGPLSLFYIFINIHL